MPREPITIHKILGSHAGHDRDERSLKNLCSVFGGKRSSFLLPSTKEDVRHGHTMTLQTERWFYRWKESGKDLTSCRIHNSKCSAHLCDIIVVELSTVNKCLKLQTKVFA
ncbi:hypothetical protein FCV25MIE_26027 [Fagus crenata]